MLPIETVLPELCASLRTGANAVLVAAPGAGKTTRAPLALLQEAWAAGGKIILLSPRRLTARAAAAQLARQLGEPVGATVGFRVRLEARVSSATRLEVVTEGVFSRMLLADPTLTGVAGVIFDEFHERHLDADLGLALALDAQAGLRPDLRLLVMSATLDAERVAGLMGGAPVIVCEGRSFPIDIRHIGRDAPRPIEDVMADAIVRALREEPGDILAFLPGQREIERVRERLEARIHDQSVDLRPLFGQMEPRAQDAAIAPSTPGRRKIALATAIAESSLNIDGVRVVVDAGLARKPRFEPHLGLMRLETVRASQAAVTQRAGRAGRTQPGVCYRLWDAGETRALAPFDTPEILETDLAGLALDLAEWGVGPAGLSWMDAPPGAAFAAAQALLRALGALDGDGRLTDHGRRIARVPLAPRLAHMLEMAGPLAPTAAGVAVLLSEQGLGGREADLSARLARFRHETGPRAKAAMELARRLARTAGGGGDAAGQIAPDAAGAALALAFPDRIAKRRGAPGADYVMSNGRAVQLGADDPLAKHEWLVVADASGQASRARILAAAALDPETVAQTLAASGVEAASAAYDPAARAIRARRQLRLGAIVVKESPEAAPGPDALEAAWKDAVARHGLAILPGAQALTALRARVAFLRGLDGAAWPDWTDAALIAQFDEWAGPALRTVRAADEAPPDRIAQAALGLLSYDQQRRLDAEAPRLFATPLGTHHEIDYACEGGPAVDVRLQALFGLTRHPMVGAGRTPLLLRLLSPAHRPVQMTRDLPGFWVGSYAQVRVEMRGRYPKHPWPDDPTAAAPTLKRKPAS